MRSKHKTDIGCGIFFLLFGVVIVVVARLIPRGLASGFGAESIPTFCGVALMLLSVCLVAEGALGLKRCDARGETAAPTEKKSKEEQKHQLHVLLTFAMVALYIILLKPVGFLIMTPLFLFGLITLVAPESKRKPLKFAGIALITTTIIYLIFHYGFAVQLPVGIFK